MNYLFCSTTCKFSCKPQIALMGRNVRLDGKRPQTVAVCCNVRLSACTTSQKSTVRVFSSLVLLIQVDGGGRSQGTLQASQFYGMHTEHSGLFLVRRTGCTPVAPPQRLCLLWHLGCCLLQQAIFHPRQQPHQPRSHLFSLSPTLFGGFLLSTQTSAALNLFLPPFYFMLVMVKRNCPKHGFKNVISVQHLVLSQQVSLSLVCYTPNVLSHKPKQAFVELIMTCFHQCLLF